MAEDGHHSSDSSGGSSSEDESGTETELMVTTRVRRITAGNRYNHVVAQEEATAEHEEDDDVALLFAEGDEEDEEYNSDEGVDEADMSSSDDDDDQGPTAGADDLEGEKEIQKEVKAEKAKKRKADMAMTTLASLKKKPKIDPTSLRRAATTPKPLKRKERVSWLPNQTSTSGRTSLRAQTIAHREETHAKLKVDEEQRLKSKAIREQREREREADAPRQMTQADRLAEAERIERKNAKSLNRWETMERRRAEEQAAKLAALKDRKLDGAVVSWYSSAHKYLGLKEDRVIPPEGVPEAKKRGRKSKAFHEQMAAARLADENAAYHASVNRSLSVSTEAGQTPPVITGVSGVPAEATTLHVTTTASDGTRDKGVGDVEKLISVQHDIPESVPSPSNTIDSKNAEVDPPKPSSTADADPQPEHPASITTLEPRSERKENTSTSEMSQELQGVPDATQVSIPVQEGQGTSTINPVQSSIAVTGVTNPSAQSDLGLSAQEVKPVIEVISTRNLVVLDKFDDLSSQARNEFNLFFNNRKTVKPTKHTGELCMITGVPARYKDPLTGIGYANTVAYKKLQELRKQQFTWSSMLGCYVGRSSFVARGVPDGFLEP